MPNGNQGHMQDGRQQGAVATSNGRGRDVGDIAVTTVAEPVPSPDAPEMRNDVTASSPVRDGSPKQQLSDDDHTRGSLSGKGDLETDGTRDREAEDARRRKSKMRTRLIIHAATIFSPFIVVLISLAMLASCLSGMTPGGSGTSGASTASVASEDGIVSGSRDDEGLPKVNIDYESLQEMFADEEGEDKPNTCGEEVADLAASLALTAINSGNPNAQLKSLGLYGTSPGQYTYTNEGRIHAHEPAYDWDATAYVVPDPRIPKAKEWIEFEGTNRNGHTSLQLPKTAGKTQDGTKWMSGHGVYADCAAMPWNVWHYFHSDLHIMDDFAQYAHIMVKSPSFGGKNIPATTMIGPSGVMTKERFQFIMTDSSKTWEEQCEPGDILCNGAIPHYMLYVGNEIAQRYFPGTTGYICESGHRSQAYWGVTEGNGQKPDGKNWFIARYIPTEEDKAAIGTNRAEAKNGGTKSSSKEKKKSKNRSSSSGSLSDGNLSSAQRSIVSAAQSTGSPGKGLCAKWITMVYQNAGIGPPYGNACDQYDWYCHSSNLSDMKPGMLVAVRQHNMTGPGSIYGHVGIYVGDGKIMDNIGYIRTMSVRDWISVYNKHAINCTVKWGWGVSGRSLDK